LPKPSPRAKARSRPGRSSLTVKAAVDHCCPRRSL
jgi:hypothetical protein